MNIDPWNVFTANFGQLPKPYTTLATLVDLWLYCATLLAVAHGRKKYGVETPRIDGPESFQRLLRIQISTLEQLALHLPLLWIAAYAMDDVFAAPLGFVWVFARSLYAVRYYQRPGRRIKGRIIAIFANAVLMIGALAGTIAAL